MEDTNTITNEQGRVRSPSPLITEEVQQENEERLDQLQSETNLKVLLKRLLEQILRGIGKWTQLP